MIPVANTANTNTWSFLIDRVNELANHMTKAVVTSDASGNTNSTNGNVIVTGSFMANSISIGSNTANIAITAPNTSQKSSGTFFLNANGSFTESPIVRLNANTTTTSPVLIDTFATSLFNSAEYLINIRDSSNSNFISTKLHLLNYNNDVLTTEYGRLISNTDFITFTANIASSNVRLYATSTISNTIIKMLRTNL